MPETATLESPVSAAASIAAAPITPAAPSTEMSQAPAAFATDTRSAEDRALDILERQQAEAAQTGEPASQVAPSNHTTTTDKPENAALQEPPPAQRREELVLARQALRRERWTEQEISDLPDDMQLKVGLKIKAKQDEQARDFARNSRRRSNQAPMGQGAEGARRSETDPEPLDRDIDSEPADKAEGVEDVLDGLDEQSRTVVTSELRRARERAASAERDAMAMRILTIRQDLSSTFPQLTTQEGLDRVTKKMDALDPEGHTLARGMDAVRQLMRDAAWIEFGDEVKNQTRRARVDSAARDIDGQVEVGTRRPAEPSTANPDDFEDAAIEAALAVGPGSLDDARKKRDDILARRRR